MVTGAGTGENLSAASTFTNTGGVASVTLNTSTVAGRDYTVRGWVTDNALLSLLMGNNRDNQQIVNIPSINHNPKTGGKSAGFLNSNREINKVSLPVRIINNTSNENDPNRDETSIYDLDDTTAVIHLVPGVPDVVSLPPASVDVLLGDQFQLTANVLDQSGNAVLNGTLVVWEIVPANNYITIENSDAVTTNGQATIDLSVEQNAPWDFDFVVRLTSEGVTGSTGTHSIDDVTPPESITNLTINPNGWTSTNDFTLSWSNPAEHAGVAGAHYSIDGSGDTYVLGGDINNLPALTLPANAASVIDVWLEDNAGNHDSGNAVSIIAKWDNTPPTAFSVNTPSEGWYNEEFLHFEWNASSDATAGLKYHKLTIDGSNVYQQHPDSTGYDVPDGFAAGTHNWTISAFDSAGNETVTSNPQTFNVDFTAPIVMSHTPVLEANHQQNISITANYRDDQSGFAATKFYYRKGGETIWTEEINNYSGENTATVGYTIFSQFVTSTGVEYWLETIDIAGNITTLPEEEFYSISISLSGNGLVSTVEWPTGIPNGNSVSDYQLISLPVNPASNTPTDVLVDDFGTYDETKWRLSTYEAGTWLEFADIQNLVSGQSYFLIVKDAGLNITTGQARTVRTDEPFQISLTTGDWTLIGNPFDFEVPLENVLINDTTSIVGDLNFYTWDGNWIQAFKLEPWQGYAYKSATGGGSLSILSRISAGGFLAKKMDDETGLNEKEWKVNITAVNGFVKDAGNRIGVLMSASDTYDRLDAFEPPVLPGGVSLRINNRNWPENGDIYTADFRSVHEDGQYWDMEVIAPDENYNTYLRFEGIEDIPEEFDVWMIDVTLGIAQDLRWKPSYRYAVSDPAGVHDLRFIAGTKEFVQANSSGVELYPDRYSLSQNYPNPFNPQTSILITLENASHVYLVVYNLLGQEVFRLADNEFRPAGYHNFIWKGYDSKGSRVASGIYFYAVRITGMDGKLILNQNRKMMMIK